MRQQTSFLAGMVAGIAVGALMAIALNPQTRRPMVQGVEQFGNRMRRMVRGSADLVRGGAEVASAVVDDMV